MLSDYVRRTYSLDHLLCSLACGLICVVDKPRGKKLVPSRLDVYGLFNRNSSLDVPAMASWDGENGGTLHYRRVPSIACSVDLWG